MKSVQHIAFGSRDRLAQEAFLTKHFGFRRVRVFNAGADNEFVMLRRGETCIEVFAGAPDAAAGEQTVGFRHLAFEVPDLDAAIAALNADGIQTDPIVDCSNVAPGMRVCFFNDPDGNRIELMQGYQDDPSLASSD